MPLACIDGLAWCSESASSWAGPISARLLGGVVRHLPAVVAGAAFHIPVAVAVVNPQDGFDDGGICHVSVFAPTSVLEGGRIQRVEPSTRIDAWLVDVVAVALADPPPVP